MSVLGESFIKAIGKPDEVEPNGLVFPLEFDQMAWEENIKEIGAGWYLHRFLYLFGEKVNRLNPILEFWSFLLPPNRERQVIGKNAYGMLLVMEDFSNQGVVAPVHVLDPLRITYWNDPNLDVTGLLGNWLPQNRIPGFLDNRLYEAWHKTTGDFPDFDEILAIREPLTLGGKMEASNFQVESVFDYYRTTGEIYAKTFKP